MKNLFLSFLFFSLYSQSAFCGYYVEFKFTGNQTFSGAMKAWYQDGNSRSEMKMGSEIPGGIGNVTMISLQNEPNKTYMLNENSKTYTEIKGSKGNEKDKKKAEDYEVVVIGKETMNGFASTHLTLKKKGEDHLMHFWLSKDVKGFAEMKKMKGKFMAEEDMYKAMIAKGIDGFPVKMKMKIEQGDIQMDLIKSEQMVIPSSKFSLEGYKKTEGNPMMPGGMDIEKLKNMSPEERQKMVEEMMKKYEK